MIDRAEREAEMREKSPGMFSHPGLQPGEVWLGDQAFEFAKINTIMNQSHGMPSARLGKETVMVPTGVNGKVENCPGRSMFVKLDELIAAIEKYEQEQSSA